MILYTVEQLSLPWGMRKKIVCNGGKILNLFYLKQLDMKYILLKRATRRILGVGVFMIFYLLPECSSLMIHRWLYRLLE